MMKKKTNTVSPIMAYMRSGFLFRLFTHNVVCIALTILAVVVIAETTSCGKEGVDTYSSSKVHQKKELTHSLLFVIGKDFHQYSDLFDYLSDVYDSESLKTNLHILTYNDMTAQTKHPRLSMISDRLSVQPAEALISIGIPEGGARILHTVKEKYPNLHIFSLLPVEEILPLEAYSDVVVDFELPDSFAKADRAVNIPAHDIQTLLLCTITAIEQIDELPEQEPFPRFARAVAAATALLDSHGITAWGGTSYTLQPYKDPELNIRSYNYLILSQPSAVGPAHRAGAEKSAAGEKQ